MAPDRTHFIVKGDLLVRPECRQIHSRSIARHSDELCPWNHSPPPPPQRNQLRDPVTVSGNSEQLAMLDRIHNLPRSRTQIILANLGTNTHAILVSTR
jgi:hypothetical protein